MKLMALRSTVEPREQIGLAKMARRLDAKRLNEQRGSGLESRMAVSPSDLPEGWRFERHSGKCCIWYDDRGKKYRSSKEVLVALRER